MKNNPSNIFYKLIFFVLSALPCSCNQNNSFSTDKEAYQHKAFEFISSDTLKCQNAQDSAIKFIALCKTGHFDNALTLMPACQRYQILGGWRFELDNTKTLVSIHTFPYEKYSSYELLMFGVYYDSRYNLNKDILDRFYRESFNKDTTNAMALYELAKLGILSMSYGRSYVLAKTVLILEPKWNNAKEIKELALKNLSQFGVPDTLKPLDSLLVNPVFGLEMDKPSYQKY